VHGCLRLGHPAPGGINHGFRIPEALLGGLHVVTGHDPRFGQPTARRNVIPQRRRGLLSRA